MNIKKLTVIVFFVILLGLPIITFLLPKKDFSEEENKKLATFPKVSVSTIQNKTFMDGFEDFVSDHFVLRSQWIAADTQMQRALGQKEVNSVFVTDDRLIENNGLPDQSAVDASVKALNRFAAKYNALFPTSMMLVPTASEVYREDLPKNAPVLDQTDFIQSFYGQLNGIDTIDAFTPLNAQKDAYIYYRTDHHWTSYGAYIGYTTLAKSLGYKSVTHDMFNIEHPSDQFLGTLYSKVLIKENLRDSIDLYTYSKKSPVDEVIINTGLRNETYSSIFFREFLTKKDKYATFLGQNQPIVTIKTNVKNGQKLLLFKDSYSHALMQFLPLHYEEITLIDLRYINGDFRQFVNIEDYTQALFLYNTGTFITDTNLKKLNLATK